MEQTTDLSRKSTGRKVGSSNEIERECMELEKKLVDIVKYVENTRGRKKKADLDTFLKLYNESGGKIAKDFLEPLNHDFLPMLPESREPGFYTLTVSKFKRKNLVSYSPICSTQTETSPIDVFIFNNGLVACALLLMRLSDLYTEKRITDAAELIEKLKRKLTMKYHLVCCPCRHSSLVLDFTLMFYCLSSRFRIFSSRYKDAELPRSEILTKLRPYFTVVPVFLENFQINSEFYMDPYYVGLIHQCGDIRRKWQFLCMGQREEDGLYEDKNGTRGPISGCILVMSFPVENVSSVFTRFLILGDNLLASINSWLLAKYLFVLLYTAGGSKCTSLKYTVKRLLACAQRLESQSYMSGERFTKYHETLQQQGHVMHILLDIPEAEEVLISSICKLLDEKSCDDELARKLTVPLVQKVASYSRQSLSSHREDEPTREDFLDILLYVRLLNPRSTAMALDVILYQYRWLQLQFRNGMESSKKFILKSAFKFLILAYPILNNEVFIRNSLQSIYFIGNNLSEIDEVLRAFKPLRKRLGNLRYLWRNYQQNDNSSLKKLTSLTSADKSRDMTTRETSYEETIVVSNDECFTVENELEDHELTNKLDAVPCRVIKLPNESYSTTETSKLLLISEEVQISDDLARDDGSGLYNNDGEEKFRSLPGATVGNFRDECMKFDGNGSHETSVESTQTNLSANSVVLKMIRTDGGNTEAVNGGSIDAVNGSSTDAVVFENVDPIDGMSTDSVNGLNTDSVNGLDTDFVNGLNTDLVNGLNTDSVNGLNTDSVNVLNTASVNVLNTASVNGLNTDSVNELNTASVNGLNTASVNGRIANLVSKISEVSSPLDTIKDATQESKHDGFTSVETNGLERVECLLLKYCKLCADALDLADQIISETIDRNVGSAHLQELHRMRSTEDAIDVCRKMKYDLVNSFPESEDLPTWPFQTKALRQNIRECLQLLIRQAQKSHCTRNENYFVPALDDVAKLKEMFLKLVQPTDDDLGHLVNWMQNLESYL